MSAVLEPQVAQGSVRVSISDADCIVERVLQAIRNSGYRELTRTKCILHQGALTLRGTVQSFHMKQVAQEAVRRVEGVQKVCNRLEVQYKIQRSSKPR